MTSSVRKKSLVSVIAFIVSAVVAMTGAIFVAPFASASDSDSQGTFTLDLGDSNTYTSGGTGSLQIGYADVANGAKVTLEIPSGVSIPDTALVVPAGNEAIKTLSRDGSGNLVIEFKDPIPSNILEGVLDIQFDVNQVEKSSKETWTWNLNGQKTTQDVVVLAPGDTQRTPNTENSSSKSGPGSVYYPAATVTDGVVDASALADYTATFTITVKTAGTARTVKISDVMDSGLSLQGTLTGTKVVTDENGLNGSSKTLTNLPAVSGSSFDYTFEAEAYSTYTFTYTAVVTDVDALEEALQTAYDTASSSGDSNYSVTINNTAIIAGEKKTADVTFVGSMPTTPGESTAQPSQAFSKSTDLTYGATIELADDGVTLSTPLDLTYTLNADLTKFAGIEDTPDRNVVIVDTLPSTTQWNTEDASFMTATGITLTQVTGVSADDFAGDEYVGTYMVDGQTLYVNVGKDTSTNASITAKAQIVNVSGVTESTDSWDLIPGAEKAFLGPKNEASFYWQTGSDPYTSSVTHKLEVMGDTSGGINDPSKFSKTGPSSEISGTAGEVINVPYTFNVSSGVGDAAQSQIIDHVDHTVFDVTEDNLAVIKDSITGTYDFNYPIDGSCFDVSLDSNGDLVLTPNEKFPQKASWGVPAAQPLTKSFTVTLSLPTIPLPSGQTLPITNSANYVGTDESFNYTSEQTASVTSFGNELEVQKSVYDADSNTYTTNLRVEVNPDGTLDRDEFIYKVDLIPHGSFQNMVKDVTDILPDQVEFEGFVQPSNVASGIVRDSEKDQITISGITAKYSDEDGTREVSIEKGKLEKGKVTSLYFKVRLKEFTKDIGITNYIGNEGATITPSNDYPLDISKFDSTDSNKVISDKNARFVLRDSDGNDVVTDIYVDGGKLRVTGKDGKETAPTVENPGTYSLYELTPPSGYAAVDTTKPVAQITVKEDTSTPETTIFNTPATSSNPTYAVGDYVWVDANGDGVQGDSEVLPGVKVTLLDDSGNTVAQTTTDENGRYLFDNLLAGTYQVKFELTAEQAEKYEFTSQDAGSDNKVDSDADPSTGLTAKFMLDGTDEALTKDYTDQTFEASEGIDPTWDAGVVLKPEPTPTPSTAAPTTPAATPSTAAPTTPAATPTTPSASESTTPAAAPSATPSSPAAAPSSSPTPSEPSNTLPLTGSNVLGLGILALVLLGVGAVAAVKKREA
ncbi:MAG: carboxypeptidase regulatory-like domain-containing protein [Ancrocorticia sp.]|jgi:DNA-directed RNA polymerase II subunit RPB1|nr:carboxypeptidase regulatory-like domain-containing protein [Ancrocorticia sp.]